MNTQNIDPDRPSRWARCRALLGRCAGRALRVFEAVPGSLKAHLNVEELARIAVTALAAGGGVFGVLQAVVQSAGTIFPAPADASLAVSVLTTILEVHRRLGHGRAAAPNISSSRTRPGLR
jgi:hypothetical protein